MHRNIFTEQFMAKLCDRMSACFCLLSENAAGAIFALRGAFLRGEGLDLVSRITTSRRLLSKDRHLLERDFAWRIDPEQADEFEHLVGAFARYFYLRLPVILSANIRGHGRPAIGEVDLISKCCIVSFEKAFPVALKREIADNLFEDFYRILREVRRFGTGGRSKYRSEEFQYDWRAIFDRLIGFPDLPSNLKVAPTCEDLLNLSISRREGDDRTVLFALCLIEIFPLFKNCLEDEWIEAMLTSSVHQDPFAS